MAGIPITIVGELYDNRLTIGGGPIMPPAVPTHPIVIPPDAISPGVPAHPIYLPPGIWGPTDPRPTPPIVIPPDALAPGIPTHPIYLPPTIWPSPGHPAHPIVLPPEGSVPPEQPPEQPPSQPADPNWVWAWNPASGWHPAYVPAGGKPQPPPV